MFSDQDPAVLYEIYKQVGRNKQLVIETILNGGVVPQELDVEEEKEELDPLDDLVGLADNPAADEINIQR